VKHDLSATHHRDRIGALDEPPLSDVDPATPAVR
jgi:hypothetical protein